MRLDQLQLSQKAVIVKILGHGAFRKRLIEMGFVRGREITALQSAPMQDPVKYAIMGYEVSLRRSEAHLIEVVQIISEQNNDEDTPALRQHTATHSETEPEQDTASPRHHQHPLERHISVALIGNPNCGKTSLFNIASGAHEHVGNYSGVTVDAKHGTFQYGEYTFDIVDLPGTYSLDAYTPEELYVRRYLRHETPDVIVNVVVASNLERNLYLTTELIDMDRRMVIALNMYDELEHQGAQLDYNLLGQMIGVPIIPTVSKSGRGIDKLFDSIIDVYEDRHSAVRHIHVNLGPEIEPGVAELKDALKQDHFIPPEFSPRYLAIKLLEGDTEARDIISISPDTDKILGLRDSIDTNIRTDIGEDVQTAIANQKYGFISGALAETLTPGVTQTEKTTQIIDAFVTNKLFGFPLFILIMLATFWLTFSLGAIPMGWIESGIACLSKFVDQAMPDGILKDLITDGIIGGVGGVIVFLPNILILYFCISFMEDSGYMARAAFIMDRIMHRIGLHGKSFIPLVMGFGCNVPAVMSTRSIESRSSRIITVLINPFMSCSARLPIYVLLIGTFFKEHAALVFFGLYILGVAVAVITARMLRRFWFHADETPFVMELPPYRIPTLKASMRHMWAKGEQYLRKMGGVILMASIAVWALNYFPIHHNTTSDATTASPISASYDNTDDSAINPDTDSFLEMIGKAVNPVMKPLGLQWRATVAAIAGIPAKEIVVSTLGVLYTGQEQMDDNRLETRLVAPNPITHTPDFTYASALAFMIFVLLYCPCMATITAIVRETGDWRYGAFSVIYNTLVAWCVAFAAYRLTLLII